MPLSHVYPMPPCSCIALPTTSTAAAAGVRLRHRGRHVDIGSILSDGFDCSTDELAGDRDGHLHVGAGVLDSLERADRPAELAAHLRVRDRRGKHGLAEPETVARDGDRCPVQQAADLFVRIAVQPQHLRYVDGFCGYGCQSPGLVEHRLWRHGLARDLDDDGAAAGIGGDHQQPIGAIGVRHELRTARETPAVERERPDRDGRPGDPAAMPARSSSRESLGCNDFRGPTARTALPR